MNDYGVGDLVRAEKGENVIIGRISTAPLMPGHLALDVPGVRRIAEAMEKEGWTITTIERAKPALPTEPGVYVSASGGPFIFKLEEDGWYMHGGGGGHSIFPSALPPVELVRLEPAKITADKVLDRLMARLEQAGVATAARVFRTIGEVRAEYQ